MPFELHRYIIGQKGSGIRKMMEEFEVSEWISTSSQVTAGVTKVAPSPPISWQ